MKRFIIFLAGFLFAVSLRSAPTPQVRADGIKALEHVRVLAADEYRGRRSGSPEYVKAAEYVAAKMKEYGLQPAGDNGTYFQALPAKSGTNFAPPSAWKSPPPDGARTPRPEPRFYTPVGDGSGTVQGPAVFAGYGVVTEKPLERLSRLDLRGKIIIILPDAPADFGETEIRKWTLEKKVKLAAERGAAGLIEMDLSESGQPPIRRLLHRCSRPGGSGRIRRLAGRPQFSR